MWRHVASTALSVLVVICIAMAGVIAWGQRQYDRPGPLAEAICLDIEGGATMQGISGTLRDRDAISSAPIFRIGASYTERADRLKAGNFLIPEGSSMSEITDIITRGGQSTCGTEIVYRIGVSGQVVQIRDLDPATGQFTTEAEFDPETENSPAAYSDLRAAPGTRYRVALAEGVTNARVIQALDAVDFLSGDIAAVPDEGMLAPDSYEISSGDDRQALIARMEALQGERLTEAWQDRAAGLPFDTPSEALILASIVEKETGVPDERRQVASVFVNRLERGMRLQTDPTVIYGITNGEGTLGRGLRRSELDRRTPYNTYQIDGLPPTPIANPGLESIRAAVDPASTPYLYFVADGSGGHAFAETLAEHNRNVAAWRALEAERAGQ